MGIFNATIKVRNALGLSDTIEVPAKVDTGATEQRLYPNPRSQLPMAEIEQ